MPNGRCRLHGGSTPVGPASPHYVTGRWSKAMPRRLLPSYEAASKDAERLALDAEIALVDARLGDVLGRVDSGESGRLWRDLRQTHSEMLDARRAQDAAGMAAAMARLGDLIARGHADWAAWEDVLGLVERRRRLVESERKRLVDMRQMVTSAEALALLSSLVDAVREHVRDRDAVAAVAAEFARLVGRADALPPAAGGDG